MLNYRRVIQTRIVVDEINISTQKTTDFALPRADVDGNTPLMLATRQGHAKVCEHPGSKNSEVKPKLSGCPMIFTDSDANPHVFWFIS